MDNTFSSSVIGAPVVSRELVLSKLAYQPIYTLPTSSKTNAAGSKDSLAVSAKNRVSLGPKLIQIVKHKLSYSAKILPLGRKETVFSKNFNTTDCENLLHTAQCSIYTTAGAIPGILFVSTERVGFCSTRSLKTYSAAGEVLKFRYKVSIPLKKIKGVEESMNKYVELVTVDDFSFWFLGFPNSNKSLRYLLQAINRSRLSVH
ncbi:GEM-like protein 7 [Bidens hawaiensis]|uniref:GEM-like protein 7 n=1 Tax=Bidens hawaiensis TaxID=980011 RepID=UPI00404B1F88